jgi:crotonobetainyl-CoA:carnitine CoA-transferase CaiB-like acyl-CoA transferase
MRHIFEDITVLDFSQVLAGPTISRFFAEMGAEILKVELPPGGDANRQLPYRHPVDGRSAYHVQQNRGKQSLCIDPRDPAGQAALLGLVAQVDVLIESFSPGTIGRLGFDWETVSALNPRLVMVSVSAFGQEGPLAHKPGYDTIAQAYAGITSMIGEPGGTPPMVSAAIGDVMTGVHGFGAVAAALFHRERTGRGQFVEVSLVDSYFHCHEINVQAHSASGGEIEPTRSGSHHYAVCPFGIFQANGGQIVICVVANEQWPRLCSVMDRADLVDDRRFADNAARCTHRAEVTEAVESWLARLPDVTTAIAALDDGRVPCAPVLSVAEAMRHPHLRRRGTVRTVTDRSFGQLDLPGFPLRFSEFPGMLDLEAPYLGEHNRSILRERLAMTDDEIDAMQRSGALCDEPSHRAPGDDPAGDAPRDT